MVNKKPNFWLVTVNLLLFLGFGGHYAYRRHQVHLAEQEAINFVGRQYESAEMMSQEDYRRVVQIDGEIKRTNSISDEDLNWWIEFINRPANTERGQRTASTRRLVALSDHWGFLTKATPQQRDVLFELAKTYLNPQPNPLLSETAKTFASGSNMIFAVSLIECLDEKRAAPLLTPFLARPSTSTLRHISQRLLARWSSPSTPSVK